MGNAVFPLLRCNSDLFIFAADLSPVAVALLRTQPEYDERRCYAFPCDITKPRGCDQDLQQSGRSLLETCPASKLDFATMIFVLSAIPAESQVGSAVFWCYVVFCCCIIETMVNPD